MKNNIHLYPGDFNVLANRIIKEFDSILEYKLVDKIILVAKREENQQFYSHKNEDVLIKRINDVFIFKNKNTLFEAIRFFLFYIKIFFFLYKKNCSYINAHTIHVLPIAVFIKKIKKKSILIYDPHELETEVAGAKGIKKKVAKIVEKFCIRFVDKVIVVSPSIKEWYINEYKKLNEKNVFIIRNIPKKKNRIDKTYDLFRKEFSISENEIVFLYQGNISKVRGCDKIVDIFKKISNKHIVFMGDGDEYVQEIINYSKKYSNIHYKNAVNFETELPKYTSSADMGLHFIKVNDVLNHKYCLPNKLFEYIVNGLPVIVNYNAVDMTHVVEKYNIGFGINTDIIDLSNAQDMINKITNQDILKYKEGISNVKNELFWENDAKQYIEIYNR